MAARRGLSQGPRMIRAFTVLFDEGCPICRTARRFVAAASAVRASTRSDYGDQCDDGCR